MVIDNMLLLENAAIRSMSDAICEQYKTDILEGSILINAPPGPACVRRAAGAGGAGGAGGPSGAGAGPGPGGRSLRRGGSARRAGLPAV